MRMRRQCQQIQLLHQQMQQLQLHRLCRHHQEVEACSEEHRETAQQLQVVEAYLGEHRETVQQLQVVEACSEEHRETVQQLQVVEAYSEVDQVCSQGRHQVRAGGCLEERVSLVGCLGNHQRIRQRLHRVVVCLVVVVQEGAFHSVAIAARHHH